MQKVISNYIYAKKILRIANRLIQMQILYMSQYDSIFSFSKSVIQRYTKKYPKIGKGEKGDAFES